MEDKNEKKPREEGHHVRRRAVREPGKISTGTEKPAFEQEKDLFRRRSLRRHYAAFRRGGLGITDSLFNAFYIILTERSLEKEQKRAEKSGKAAAAEMNLMEHHAGGLRFLSSVLVAHDLQRWAGWSNIQMAQRYVHEDFSQLEAAVSRLENVG